MAKKQSVKKKRRVSKIVLGPPDLDQAKSAVLNSLSAVDAQRGHRHAIKESVEWYCLEPRLSFGKTVASGIAYTSTPGIWRLAPSISASAPCAASLTRLPTAVY
jgi:hypothetical protein